MQSIRLLWKLICVSLRSQMQHRTSFLLETIACFFSSATDIFGIWILIDRFHSIQGWTLPEIAIIYGVIHMGFAFSESTARSFDKFSQLVRTGAFDRVLLRPVSTIVQVATHHIQLLKIGRFLQGLLVLLWGAYELNLSFFSFSTVVIFLSVVGTACLFYGLFMIQATFSFWTTETLQLIHMTTYGGRETGQYPMIIFPTAFRLFFTIIVPIACIGYYPIATVLHHESFPLFLAVLSPLSGVLFLFLAIKCWHWGVLHYRSSGS